MIFLHSNTQITALASIKKSLCDRPITFGVFLIIYKLPCELVNYSIFLTVFLGTLYTGRACFDCRFFIFLIFSYHGTLNLTECDTRLFTLSRSVFYIYYTGNQLNSQLPKP